MKNNNNDAISVTKFVEELPVIKSEKEQIALDEFNEVFTSNDVKGIEKLPEKFKALSNDSKEEVMNATKFMNRKKILEAIDKLKPSLKRLPSALEIAVEVKLSHRTVYAHLEEMRELEFQNEEMLVLTSQRYKYLKIIADSALESKDPKSAKMMLDILSASSKKEQQPMNVTNAIQIVMSLPKEEQEKIKTVLLNSESVQIKNAKK